MPDITVYSSNPGLAVLLSKGAQFNVIQKTLQKLAFATGEGVLGLVGSVVNDQGAPNVPVELVNKIDTIRTDYGGFSEYLGEGHAAGYEGNLYARARGLDAPRVVLQPVDLAVKTAGDVVCRVTLKRTTGAYGTFTVPAGTRLADDATTPTYVVATLEDVTFSGSATAGQLVRVRQVDPTQTAVATVAAIDVILDTLDDTDVSIDVAGDDAPLAPVEVDAAELAARYATAADLLTVNAAGKAINVVVCDQDVYGIQDDLVSQVETFRGQGYLMVAVVSPPVGTTAATAQSGGDASDGVDRSSLDGSICAYVHEGVQRAFLEDSDNLTAPDYLVTLPAAMVFAACIANTPPEQNPAQPGGARAKITRSYGIVAQEALATPPTNAGHYAANIVRPVFERRDGRMVASFRDGILANGVKIADQRLQDFLAVGLTEALNDYHKAPATLANREAAEEAADGWLAQLKAAGRIADYAVSLDWDADNDHLTVNVAVDKTGNMDVITFALEVGGSAVAAAGIQE